MYLVVYNLTKSIIYNLRTTNEFVSSLAHCPPYKSRHPLLLLLYVVILCTLLSNVNNWPIAHTDDTGVSQIKPKDISERGSKVLYYNDLYLSCTTRIAKRSQ